MQVRNDYLLKMLAEEIYSRDIRGLKLTGLGGYWI